MRAREHADVACMPLTPGLLSASQSELVCIGQDLDHAATKEELKRCLLTDEEMDGGVESWAALPDPFRVAWDLEFAAGEAGGASHKHDHHHGDDHAP